MEMVAIPRVIFGLALVLFIPGFTLTLALWPKTKKEVYSEILKILKNNKISNASIVGKEDDAENLLLFLKENSIKAGFWEEGIKDARALILTGRLEDYAFTIPKDKTIIDLGNNPLESIKVEDTIDAIERAALSFGLSIALVPLIGIILDKVGFGIRLISILSSLIFVIALFLGIYYYRRKSIEI